MTDSQPRLSFEFFPPKTVEGKEKLIKVRDQLNEFEPDFFSVTYGAGGSTGGTRSGGSAPPPRHDDLDDEIPF